MCQMLFEQSAHKPVYEQFGGQPFGAGFAEDHIVGFQRLQMDARRQRRMHTLGKAFGYFDAPRNDLVLCVARNGLNGMG